VIVRTESSRHICSRELLVSIQIWKKFVTLRIKVLNDRTLRLEKITLFRSFYRTQNTTAIMDNINRLPIPDNYKAESRKAEIEDNYSVTL
jgi:hypothetical protein